MNDLTQTDLPPTHDGEKPDNDREAKRSTSKISRLPVEIRKRLNELLFDGLAYEDVLRELGDSATDITPRDISRWFQGPHKLWLQQMQWNDHLRMSLEAAKDMCEDKKVASIHEANLHLAASQIHNAILGCDLETLPDAVKQDPEKLLKVIHAIPQYSSQALNYQKYKDACENARVELQKLRDPNRPLNDDERRIIVDKVDQILGLK